MDFNSTQWSLRAIRIEKKAEMKQKVFQLNHPQPSESIRLNPEGGNQDYC